MRRAMIAFALGFFGMALLWSVAHAGDTFRYGGDPQPVPEPASMLVLGTGVVAVALRRLRKRK